MELAPCGTRVVYRVAHSVMLRAYMYLPPSLVTECAQCMEEDLLAGWCPLATSCLWTNPRLVQARWGLGVPEWPSWDHVSLRHL